MATVKEKTKAMNKIQQLTPKLAKGGLASRKEVVGGYWASLFTTTICNGTTNTGED
jgi:hypothetical protein